MAKRRSADVNPEMVVLARETRGLTQAALSELLGVSQSKLSKVESGLLILSEPEIEAAAGKLAYPRARLSRQGQGHAFGTDGFHHRKRYSLPMSDQKRVHAEVRFRSDEIGELLRDVELETAGGFEPIDPDLYGGDIERIAALIRTRWRVAPGPIPNVVDLIERNGGVVVPCRFDTDKLDAIGRLCPTLPPLIFLNVEKPGERQRLTLGHEVGHLIMHAAPTADVESEANRFAAAFLMPRADIHAELCPPLNYAKLLALKRRWRVSMQALIHRAHDLGTISDRTYRNMFTDIGKRGWRRSEPEPIDPEVPTLIDEVIALHRTEHGYSIEELSEKVGLLPDEFRRIYLPGGRHIKLVS